MSGQLTESVSPRQLYPGLRLSSFEGHRVEVVNFTASKQETVNVITEPGNTIKYQTTITRLVGAVDGGTPSRWTVFETPHMYGSVDTGPYLVVIPNERQTTVRVTYGRIPYSEDETRIVSAIRLPNAEFRPLEGDSIAKTLWRAAAESWLRVADNDFPELLTGLPKMGAALRIQDGSGGTRVVSASSSDYAFVRELTESLPPVKKLHAMSLLSRWGDTSVDAEFEPLLWECRDLPNIDLAAEGGVPPGKIGYQARRGLPPKNRSEYIEKAIKARNLAVKQYYLRNSSPADEQSRRLMAGMLRTEKDGETLKLIVLLLDRTQPGGRFFTMDNRDALDKNLEYYVDYSYKKFGG
jgi:hypothetical protein